MASIAPAGRITADHIRVILMGLHQLALAGEDPALVSNDPVQVPLVPGPGISADIDKLLGHGHPYHSAASAREILRAPDAIRQAITAASVIYQRLHGQPELVERFERYYDLMAAACATANPNAATGLVALDLDSDRHLPHLRRVYIETAEDQPDLILLGAPGEIRIPGAYPIARHVRISYRNGQNYPTLLLTALSRFSGEPGKPTERTKLLQKATPNFDLEIYSHYRPRLLGHVRTSFMEEQALDVTGRRIRLKLAVGAGARLLCTQVADVEGREIVGCIHVITATSIS